MLLFHCEQFFIDLTAIAQPRLERWKIWDEFLEVFNLQEMVNFDETSKIQVNLNSMQGQIGADFKIPLFKKKKTSETCSSEGKFDQT